MQQLEQAPPAALAHSDIWVRCGRCDHQWVAGFLPQPMIQFARALAALHCPNCSAPSTQVFLLTNGAKDD